MTAMNIFKTLITTFSIGLLLSCNTQNNNDPSKKSEQENTKINAVINSDAVSASDAITKGVDEDELTNILVFTKVLGKALYSYKLEFTGEDVKITYIFDKHEPIIERGKYIDRKIIVNGCDYCYKFENTAECNECQVRWELYVYNGETDYYDNYYYDSDGSNSVVMDIY